MFVTGRATNKAQLSSNLVVAVVVVVVLVEKNERRVTPVGCPLTGRCHGPALTEDVGCVSCSLGARGEEGCVDSGAAGSAVVCRGAVEWGRATSW